MQRDGSVPLVQRVDGRAASPLRDRMTVAGLIPMHTPDEAIAELEHIRRIG
jgi:hypothetical protein